MAIGILVGVLAADVIDVAVDISVVGEVVGCATVLVIQSKAALPSTKEVRLLRHQSYKPIPWNCWSHSFIVCRNMDFAQ